jgi:pyruvate/2-oxoglutarate dehydrogenase complex dihydrolipoamide acyltransferase (E2) component
MPKMGESVQEGKIIRWVKRVGERVEQDETLLEISTDKVDTEIPAPASGVLAEILAPEGETVPVGTVIARIEVEVAAEGAAPAPEPEKAVEAAPAASVEPAAPSVSSSNSNTLISSGCDGFCAATRRCDAEDGGVGAGGEDHPLGQARWGARGAGRDTAGDLHRQGGTRRFRRRHRGYWWRFWHPKARPCPWGPSSPESPSPKEPSARERQQGRKCYRRRLPSHL